MTNENIENRIRDLEREIAGLPGGSIASKRINGKIYYYHRISVNGKRKEIYIDTAKVDALREQIERCRLYMKELKELQAMLPSHSSTSPSAVLSSDTGISDAAFRTYLRIGDGLRRFASPVKKLRQRDCFDRLNDYILNDSEKVMILYGLRRTGKTTLIRQVVAGMDEEALSHSAFMQVKAADTLADVYADLRLLEAGGFRNVFIDEVTLLRDFIGGAALFSDIFAASGMKLVLSGTDSLGFVFSGDEQLFDRCEMIHTTFIPYREFERVLGRKGIDEYIRYGGTMTPGGSSYNDPSIFVDPARTGEYVDSAIAKNIQHSLLCYQDGGHFMGLRELFEKNELTSAINRVVEDMNHRFTVETLTRAFRSNDLALSTRNLRHDRFAPSDILDRIDTDAVTEKIKTALSILNRDEQRVPIKEYHAAEIKEYLKLLDLVAEIPLRFIPSSGSNESIPVITQPGLRFVQAEELVKSLLADRVFSELSIIERNEILGRILSEIKGRMLEEILLLETSLANPEKKVFKLQFPVGEFDMVVFDPETLTCKIYEIKHSEQSVSEQCRHLRDDGKCASVTHDYGEITGKYVIYCGPPKTENEVEYLNAEEYLRSLAEIIPSLAHTGFREKTL